jgi:ATP-dependent Clp protease protease subunit
MDGGDPRSWMRRKLFDLRIVLLSGPVDDEAGHEVGVELMTLDAIGDGPVHLQIDSAGGTLAAALALMDIIDVLGVPVRASCVGQAVGPSVGVLAVCSHRLMSAHARLRLLEPSVEVQGSARQLEQLATAHADQWTAFCARLSEVTGRPLERVLDDADRGRFLSAQEAIDYGLVDEVAAADARMYRLPGRPIGFGFR